MAVQYTNIGILGGMFDPVHNGHLRTALEVRECLSLDELRLLPAGRPPHRDAPQASPAQRLAMLERGVAGQPGFVIDRREVERQGPSYMVDTLASLRRDLPGARLHLVLGSDAFNLLPGWERWEALFDLAHLVVITRPGWGLDPQRGLEAHCRQRLVRDPGALANATAGYILPLELTLLEISSSHVRELISQGKSVRYLVPDDVWNYLEAERLYR